MAVRHRSNWCMAPPPLAPSIDIFCHLPHLSGAVIDEDCFHIHMDSICINLRQLEGPGVADKAVTAIDASTARRPKI